MVLLIDNYDSFTYNLVQTIGALDANVEIRVHRNDEISIEQIEAAAPSHIIISPGPCTPREGGVSNNVIRHFRERVPLLGVCLGHQCIGYVAGGNVIRAHRLMHGKTSMISHDNEGVFRDLPDPFEATRYHSLIIEEGTLPEEYVVCATCADDPSEIMGLRHREWPLFGVQFHPESFLTTHGSKLLANFLAIR